MFRRCWELPKFTDPHPYVGDPDGEFSCKACGKPVRRGWVYFRGFYYHKDCLKERYPKLGEV